MKQFTVWVDRVCEPYGVGTFDTETQAREYIKSPPATLLTRADKVVE